MNSLVKNSSMNDDNESSISEKNKREGAKYI